jgi:hypothetical protein
MVAKIQQFLDEPLRRHGLMGDGVARVGAEGAALDMLQVDVNVLRRRILRIRHRLRLAKRWKLDRQSQVEESVVHSRPMFEMCSGRSTHFVTAWVRLLHTLVLSSRLKGIVLRH